MANFLQGLRAIHTVYKVLQAMAFTRGALYGCYILWCAGRGRFSQ